MSKLGQYAAAIIDTKSCIIRKPSWSKGYYRAGLAFKAMGMHVPAIDNNGREGEGDQIVGHELCRQISMFPLFGAYLIGRHSRNFRPLRTDATPLDSIIIRSILNSTHSPVSRPTFVWCDLSRLIQYLKWLTQKWIFLRGTVHLSMNLFKPTTAINHNTHHHLMKAISLASLC